MKKSFIALVLICLIGLLFTSCTNRIGYSTVLWSIPEKDIYSGDMIEVYIKSNISKVYIVEDPNTGENIELPLWQITEPDSKSQTRKVSERLEEYKHSYARVALDGLPIRFEPVNTARQVYRLKENEIVKPLYAVEGVPVMSGGKPMDGTWLRVLTQDGTFGYCFSYNLRLFDEREGQIEEVVTEEKDTTLENILANRWYPESFLSMINSGQINLSLMDPNSYFNIGVDTGIIILKNTSVSRSYEYKGIEKTGYNKYELTETPVTVLPRRDDFITVQFIDDAGLLQSHNFVKIETPISEIVSIETERRKTILREIALFSPTYSSSNYGKLSIKEDGTFSWSGYGRLVPSLIQAGSGNSGNVKLDRFLSSALTATYDGVLTFTFDGKTKPLYFFYRLEDNGLRLEDASLATLRGNEFTERNNNALILFFGK